MLQELFLALHIADSSFYAHPELHDAVAGIMLRSNERHGAFIAGPSLLNQLKDPVLPIYLATKRNSIDNSEYSPISHGNLIISSMQTGEVRIAALWGEPDGKIPVKEPVSANQMILSQAHSFSYSFEDKWIDLMPGKEIPPYDGAIVVRYLYADQLSNSLVINVVNAVGSESEQIEPLLATDYCHAEEFRKYPCSPLIPTGEGIAFSNPNQELPSRSKPYYIYASFKIPLPLAATQKSAITLNLIMTSKDANRPGALLAPVVIPDSNIRTESIPQEVKGREITQSWMTGHFRFDIRNFFNTASQGNIPRSMYITGVYKKTFSGPVRIK